MRRWQCVPWLLFPWLSARDLYVHCEPTNPSATLTNISPPCRERGQTTPRSRSLLITNLHQPHHLTTNLLHRRPNPNQPPTHTDRYEPSPIKSGLVPMPTYHLAGKAAKLVGGVHPYQSPPTPYSSRPTPINHRRPRTNPHQPLSRESG